MLLRKFSVTNFRSVADSEPIEVDKVAALIGTNESGKTNLLLPLWKLNPAREGAIQPTADYPRRRFTEIRNQGEKPVFIEAIFSADDDLANELAALTHAPVDAVREISVTRSLDGKHHVDFPSAKPARAVEASRLRELLDQAAQELEGMTPLKSEESTKAEIIKVVREAQARIGQTDTAGADVTPDLGPGADADASKIGSRGHLERISAALRAVSMESAPKTSAIAPRFERLREEMDGLIKEVSHPHPRESEAAIARVLERLPKFVYYSNYGNLDSEIYLPHVIQNLERTDLGTREAAKARTLRVLFKFVGLKPQEILELGREFQDPKSPGRLPTPEEAAAIAEKKKERSILLQSASATLTARFREWWKQGDYRFRFEADGDHFRIWVSDDRRPEEVELENRSTGLQWFLSFYLVFLVESEEAHAGAILLLDEPGLSLHPLAQKDLSLFFDGLAEDNQLIYTTHSPFLVDADRLERARKVYIAADGTTKSTPDLRGGEGDTSQRGAGYAVFAAVGLSVADSLLIGCTPVIVEGPSDQHYLTAMKILLIADGRLRPGRELVFPAAAGAKTVKALASVLGARDDDPPIALFDSDTVGKRVAQELRNSLYVDARDRVLEVETFAGLPGAEVEDLLPPNLIIQHVDRLFKEPNEPFADVYVAGRPIVDQIESWAQKHQIALVLGWKVELAKRVKQALLQRGPRAVTDEVLDRWATLFAALERREPAEASPAEVADPQPKPTT